MRLAEVHLIFLARCILYGRFLCVALLLVSTVFAAQTGQSSDDSKIPHLLLLPPITDRGIDPAISIPQWVPWQFFDSGKACEGEQTILILNSLDRIRTPKGREERVHAQMALSRCVPLQEYGISEEADVVAVSIWIEGNFEGLVTSGLVGRVFNRGKKTARSVVLKYWVRTTSGTNVTEGEIPVVPADIPELAFGHFRGRIGSMVVTADHVVSVEFDWSKEGSSSSSSGN